MALSAAKKKKIMALLAEEGLSEAEVKELGLSDDELLALADYAGDGVISIEIEVDTSHRLTDEEFLELIKDGLGVIKGRKTMKQVFELANVAIKGYLRYQTAGIVG